jgi:hypothetical protein
MGDTNVKVGTLEELLLVLPPEDLATTAADRPDDIDSHLANRTARADLIFRPVNPLLWRRPRTRAGGSPSPA